MPEDYDLWLGKQPRWLQTAASNLLATQRMPDDSGIVGLADLCQIEEAGGIGGFTTVPPGSFSAPPLTRTIRLSHIRSLCGINALDKDAGLDFGDACLGVVYGHNGTGKSGFARLTKQAANSRIRAKILSNVFSTDDPEISAEFVIASDGTERTVTWRAVDGPVHELRNMHVFDAEVARSYITDEAEASYEPRRLRFITALVNVCDQVKVELQHRSALLTSSLPGIPTNLVGTPLAVYVTGMKATLSVESLVERITQSPDHTERIRSLQEALQIPDPSVRINAIDRALIGIQSLKSMLDPFTVALSARNVEEVTGARTTATALRQIANETATATLGCSHLPGIGGQTWRAMWEAARLYSTSVAYPRMPFPNTEGSFCPLCQQKLGEEASDRLSSFERFVIGQVEGDAKGAEEAHKELLRKLPAIQSIADWAHRFEAIPGSNEMAIILHQSIAKALELLATSLCPAEVPPVDFIPFIELIATNRADLDKERDLLVKTQKEDQRLKLELELNELLMVNWCNEHKTPIIKELERRKKAAVIDGALKRTNTAQLTKMKGELAQAELTGGYQERFEDELKALGASRLLIKPVEASRAKGRFTFSLAIVGAKKNAKPNDVLSEGEARIVSLAAFLADVSVAGARTPFLFDDPISSLDADFEERVVDRLINLAKVRQVLVFTHRLSLLTLLREAVDKDKKAAEQIHGMTAITMKEIALRRLDERIGLVTDTNVLESKVEKALNDIINRRLVIARKFVDAGDVDSYSSLMKGICSDIRILAERSVEEELLNRVVLRFRRKITTQDKLTSLAKIQLSDCTFIDRLMTRFSGFEHPQPEELPAPLPSYDEVLGHAQELKSWVIEFRGRSITEATIP